MTRTHWCASALGMLMMVAGCACPDKHHCTSAPCQPIPGHHGGLVRQLASLGPDWIIQAVSDVIVVRYRTPVILSRPTLIAGEQVYDLDKGEAVTFEFVIRVAQEAPEAGPLTHYEIDGNNYTFDRPGQYHYPVPLVDRLIDQANRFVDPDTRFARDEVLEARFRQAHADICRILYEAAANKGS